MQFNINPFCRRGQAGARCNDRRSGRRWVRALACLAALVAFAGIAHPGQHTAPGMPIRDEMPTAKDNQPPDANAVMEMREAQTQKQNFEEANIERKKQIAEDSAKLLKLATDLKTEVDKTTKDTLSLNVIRKADEIEKLAHAVKEKMKLSVGAS